MRAILILVYKYKLLLYSKIYVFSFVYSLGFIAMNIIQMVSHLNYYTDGFLYVYYFNIILELFFSIVFTIIFYPQRNLVIYNFEYSINYNSIYCVSEITSNKEKNMKMNKLSKKMLKYIYLKKEYPLVLIEPFAKTEHIFNDTHIHLGITTNV